MSIHRSIRDKLLVLVTSKEFDDCSGFAVRLVASYSAFVAGSAGLKKIRPDRINLNTLCTA